MPEIIDFQEMTEPTTGPGWTMRRVADAAHIGAPVMVACWWIFQPGAHGPDQTRGKEEELLYVIRGSGQAEVDGQTFDLDDESVLWVEEGETYHFVAGENGLEILQGYAPGDEAHG